MKKVDVSVIAANYNNSAYLEQFLKSILESTAVPAEIILVDDASTDDSIRIIQSFIISNLRLVSLKENVGFSNALNIGVENATCKYLMRVDPDDLIDKERIEAQYEFLENNPNIDILGSNCIYFNESLGKIVARSNVRFYHEEIVSRYQNGEHGMIHGTIMCRANVLKRVKYIQDNYPAEEYDIFSRMILNGYRFHNLEKPYLTYRIHGKSISNKMPYATVKKISELNEKYFNRRNSPVKVLRMFLFLRNYRNFLENGAPVKRYLFLIVCIIIKPESVINRLKSKRSVSKTITG